jgi:hypothetical protein
VTGAFEGAADATTPNRTVGVEIVAPSDGALHAPPRTTGGVGVGTMGGADERWGVAVGAIGVGVGGVDVASGEADGMDRAVAVGSGADAVGVSPAAWSVPLRGLDWITIAARTVEAAIRATASEMTATRLDRPTTLMSPPLGVR